MVHVSHIVHVICLYEGGVSTVRSLLAAGQVHHTLDQQVKQALLGVSYLVFVGDSSAYHLSEPLHIPNSSPAMRTHCYF